MYTTIAKVRELSGFDDSTNITDAVVKGKIITASSMFDSSASQRYSLPILIHRSNTLIFSGAGVGADTMTIVINGVDYDIAISNGLTAAQAADLFRDVSMDSIDFVVDTVYGEEQVTIKSKDCTSTFATGNAQVNITSAPTTEGIVGTIGNRIDNYAGAVDQMVAEIAAALLLIDNYGIEAADTNRDGQNRMDAINDTLQKLQGVHPSGQTINLYDDICSVAYAESSSSLPSFYPNNTSDVSITDPTAPKFTTNSVY